MSDSPDSVAYSQADPDGSLAKAAKAYQPEEWSARGVQYAEAQGNLAVSVVQTAQKHMHEPVVFDGNSWSERKSKDRIRGRLRIGI